MEITVRKALQTDFDDIVKLEAQLIDYEKTVYPVRKSSVDYTISAVQKMLKELDRGELDIFIAISNEKVIGLVAGHESDETCDTKNSYYIEDLVIDESERGAGIGTFLLNYIKDYAIKNGYQRLSIGVLKANERVSSYYEKFGFNIYGLEMEMDLPPKP